MVASDTVVGLVGAGILLVALVGVFVYESQQGGAGGAELKNANYSVSSTGSTFQNVPGTGQQIPQADRCVNNPPTQPCTVQGANVKVQLEGLPSPGNLKYVVFLEGSPDTRPVGEATASGSKFIINEKKVDGNFGSNPKLGLCLEPSGAAVSCTWKIGTFNITGTTIQEKSDIRFVTTTGNHTLTLTASASETRVDARLENLQNKTGYEYRGWMVREDDTGRNYTFVGKFFSDGGVTTGNEMDGNIRGTVAGSRNNYNQFIVTIEPSGSSTTGMKPAGPPVIVADYNPRSSTALEK